MRSQFLTTVGAAALTVALSLSCAYAGPSTEGGPSAGAAAGAPQAGGPGGPAGGTGPASPQARDSGPGNMTGGAKGGPTATGGPGPNSEQAGEQVQSPAGTSGKQREGAARTDQKPGDKSAKRKGRENKDSAEMDESDSDAAKMKGRDEDDPKMTGRDEKDSKKISGEEKAAKSDKDNSREAGDHKRGKTAKIEPREKQKVKTYFSEHKPRAKRLDRNDVSVSIGIGIPGSIALYPLPSDVVIVSADCPLQYFVWADSIVLVDSCSREVVDIIPGVV